MTINEKIKNLCNSILHSDPLSRLHLHAKRAAEKTLAAQIEKELNEK